jgi:hypothetical protein
MNINSLMIYVNSDFIITRELKKNIQKIYPSLNLKNKIVFTSNKIIYNNEIIINYNFILILSPKSRG